LADRLKIDFALIHRERYHARDEANEPKKSEEARLTLVGDVKDKPVFIVVRERESI